MCICIYVHMYAYGNNSIFFTYVLMHVCMYICITTHIYYTHLLHTFTTHIYYTQIGTSVCSLHMCVCMCVCTHVCVYVPIYIYMYIYKGHQVRGDVNKRAQRTDLNLILKLNPSGQGHHVRGDVNKRARRADAAVCGH